MNSNQHGLIGAAAGTAFTFAKYLKIKEQKLETAFPWGELLLYSGLGFLLASLPDWLEPACNPNHRKFLHSLAMMGLVGYGAFGKHTNNMDEDCKKVIQAFAVSYISHLSVDATTKKSIPIIHPKFV